MQRISRGWLGKRRVALLRCTRLSTLKGGIPRGYVVMRRLSDVKNYIYIYYARCILLDQISIYLVHVQYF